MSTTTNSTIASSSALPPLLSAQKGCGRNFSIGKDEQLCRSWLDISQDPVAGSDQRQSTFWQRIFSHFNEFKITPEERTEDALQSRWGTIQKGVNKFCGVYAQIE